MNDVDAEYLNLDRELERLELTEARERLAVYAGLHIPEEIEREDLAGQEKLTMAARYIPAEHHRLLIEKLQEVERGKIKRLMVFMPPGSAKSTYGSVLFPSWYLGRHPTHCLLQGSYNEDLAARFGRRARNTFASDVHEAVFGVRLDPSSKAAGDWGTEQGGEYYSFGFKTGIAGRRADGVIIDDPIKGRAEADSKNERERVWETYTSDVRPRLKPKAWIVYFATRWHEDDPAGRILPKEAVGRSGWFTAKDGERWYVLSLAAVMETEEDAKHDPLNREVGDILWPEWFSKEQFAQEKRTQGARNWNALYQQRPRPDEGSILLRQWWRPWDSKDGKPPTCLYVVQVYDTAFEEEELGISAAGKKRGLPDYSARTTWGVFEHAGTNGIVRPCAILLEAWRDRIGFPELRELAWKSYQLWKPDKVLIEKKASGHSLLQEMRKKKVPVLAVVIAKGASKTVRAHAASIVPEQGAAFYMATRDGQTDALGVVQPRADLAAVVDECTEFPFGAFDDWADTVVHAWLWLRRTMWVQLPGEAEQEQELDEDAIEQEAKSERRMFG